MRFEEALIIVSLYLGAVYVFGSALLLLEMWWQGMPAWLRLQVPDMPLPLDTSGRSGFWTIVGRVPVYIPGDRE